MAPMVLLALLLLVFVMVTAGVKVAAGRVIAGAFIYLLGAASFIPDRGELLSLPTEFVAVSAGFIWLGGALILWGLFAAFHARDQLVVRRLAATALGVALIGLLPLLYAWCDLLLAASWRGLLAAAGLGGAGVFLLSLLHFI